MEDTGSALTPCAGPSSAKGCLLLLILLLLILILILILILLLLLLLLLPSCCRCAAGHESASGHAPYG